MEGSGDVKKTLFFFSQTSDSSELNLGSGNRCFEVLETKGSEEMWKTKERRQHKIASDTGQMKKKAKS